MIKVACPSCKKPKWRQHRFGDAMPGNCLTCRRKGGYRSVKTGTRNDIDTTRRRPKPTRPRRAEKGSKKR